MGLLAVALAVVAVGSPPGNAGAMAAAAGSSIACPSWDRFAVDEDRYVGDEGHGGLFVFATRQIILSPAVCAVLRWIGRGEEPSPGTRSGWGSAVYTFAHELQHAAGIRDEDDADCGAARSYLDVARRLGASRRVALRLLRRSMRSDGYDPSNFMSCIPTLMPAAQ